MKITKRQDNPNACAVFVDGVEFVALFETLKNDINGNRRRRVFITWDNKQGAQARAFIIKLNYETEEEAAEQLARYVVSTWKK